MSEPFLVGVIGARGHTGRELLRLISGHPELMLAYAVSREYAGRPVSDIAPEDRDECVFEALTPEKAAPRRADAVFLATPDGASAPYIDAFEKEAPHRILIDLSADRRFDEGWAYGLPELFRSSITGKARIANPGCYATAMQLIVHPLKDHLDGVPALFGVSGYSGAGTTPSPRNDPARLADNLMPYGLVDHKHEREVSHHMGAPIRFFPHVHPAFSGLLVTAHVPLKDPLSADALKEIYAARYADEKLITLRNEPPELQDGAGARGVVIGGFAVSKDGRNAVVVAAEDNLLKGAAVQAIQNLNLALGLPELMGLVL
ncbi:MAG: N-acetyl-gamma-glutamyl-phosphate reductase [Pseudomonadota bacterium]